jgi:phosphocarrier protein
VFSQQIVVTNPTGLHARPASQLTQFAKSFDEKILLKYGAVQADPKSIIALLAAGIKSGAEITVEVTGDKEQETGEKLINFLRNLRD